MTEQFVDNVGSGMVKEGLIMNEFKEPDLNWSTDKGEIVSGD